MSLAVHWEWYIHYGCIHVYILSVLLLVGTACMVCGAGFAYWLGVRLSVCLLQQWRSSFDTAELQAAGLQ